MTQRRSLAGLLTLLLVLTGCQVPRFEGPQIQQPPPGFLLQPESHPQRRVLADHEVSFHTSWVHTDVSGVSIIYIDEHPTVVGIEDVMAAQDDARATAQDPDLVVGDIEALRIDGRDAWGWYERVESPRRGLVEVTYNAIIPYDSVTYTVEFTSGEPSWKRGAPEALRAVIGSFGIGRTTYNVPLIAIVFGSLLLGASMLRARAKERADRLRSINLVTIKKEEEPEEVAGAPEAEARPNQDPPARNPDGPRQAGHELPGRTSTSGESPGS